ncbi:hypothetical protein STRIC_1932 [Streptococcus ictaluri 707-05]|uniref:Uncharacterized protein n=1 Tax=Streptococcus ictaluri 707-05 TaxID=764299 RepID=G5K544_9STRE|nr:hypothetical protein STRIC_1932 [Streptococcus ictaluri 707-05]
MELDDDYAKALATKGDTDYFTDLQMFGPSNTFELKENAGDSRSVDPNKLSDDDLIDLSNYTASIVNQIRNQARKAGAKLNAGNVFVTNGATKFAKNVADGYRKDNFNSFEKGHDYDDINNAASSNGLQTSPGKNIYEDAGMAKNSDTDMFTLKDLKERILQSIEHMMNNDHDSNWAHTESLVGTGISGAYLGTSLSRIGNVVTVHILQVSDSQILSEASFDKAKIDNPYQGDFSDNSGMRSRFEAAKAKLTEAKETLSKRQAELKAAEAKSTELHAKLDQLKALQIKLQATVPTDKAMPLSVAHERKAQTAQLLTELKESLELATQKLTNLKAMAPKGDMPEVKTPMVDTPEVDRPKIEAPIVETSKAKKSKAEAPELKAPEVDLESKTQNKSTQLSPSIQKTTQTLMAKGYQPKAYQAQLPQTNEKKANLVWNLLGLSIISALATRLSRTTLSLNSKKR